MFHLSSSFVGLIGAISSNAISAGVGALVGGRLCDKLGRKKIYQWDMLLYAFGLLFIIFASASWMLLAGYVIAGLAVGADVPASWTLIAELAPDGARGKHSGVAQVLWYCGPVVVLLLSLALSPLGVLGIRIVFAQLFVVAIGLWFARRGMKESEIWATAEKAVRERATRAAGQSRDAVVTSFGHVRELFNRRNVGAMLFLIGMYGIWNLWAGTNGFFLPFILRTVGSESQAMSVTIQCVSFAAGIASIRPHPGGELSWASGSYRCVRGPVGAGWRRSGDTFTYRVELPPNVTASVRIPSDDPSQVRDRRGRPPTDIAAFPGPAESRRRYSRWARGLISSPVRR